MREPDLIKSFNYMKKKMWGEAFSRFDARSFEKLLRTKGEEFWVRAGEKRAFRLFHEAAGRVPAYKEFLRKHKVNYDKICEGY